jgi:hypothetical protein
MQRILSALLCAALVLPTLETVMSELGLLDIQDGLISLVLETEEKKETEKEGKKEKELEKFDLAQDVLVGLASKCLGWVEDSHYHRSWISEIPSPPPDYIV